MFPLYSSCLEPIPISRQDLGSRPKKCTHGGYPLESPLVVKRPHVMSLHQSASLIKSLNPVARSVWAHSSLIHQANQDGELTPVYCVVLGADCHIDRHAEDLASPAHGPWVVPRAVPSLYAWGVAELGQNVPVGPSHCQETRPWGPSTPHGWWVLQLSFFGVWDPFPYTFFWFFIEVFKGFEFLRTVLWPIHLCLCPRRARLNWAARFWVPACSCWFSFFR